jgi:hypothetical protein
VSSRNPHDIPAFNRSMLALFQEKVRERTGGNQESHGIG